jgi:chromosome partitioning protein
LHPQKEGQGKQQPPLYWLAELARQGAAKGFQIAMIDADPNQHSAAWANKEGRPENIKLIENATEENILDAIDEAESKAAFVIVDLEGVASSAVIGAVSRADLVVIPCQPSQNDAKEAVKTIKTIQYSARVAGRKIPFAVLFTRLSAAIITKTGKHLAAEFDGAGVDLFECSLIDREAFKSVFFLWRDSQTA